MILPLLSPRKHRSVTKGAMDCASEIPGGSGSRQMQVSQPLLRIGALGLAEKGGLFPSKGRE